MEQLSHFSPASTAIVDIRFKDYLEHEEIETNSNQTIALTSFHPENMIYATSSSANSFAVFSEIWYKGNEDWKAYIDGNETEFIRVNYLLRGLKIPKGNHEIIFKFHPKSHYSGAVISLITSILIVLLCIGLFIAKAMKFPLPGFQNNAK